MVKKLALSVTLATGVDVRLSTNEDLKTTAIEILPALTGSGVIVKDSAAGALATLIGGQAYLIVPRGKYAEPIVRPYDYFVRGATGEGIEVSYEVIYQT